jgi:hypothetical protein
MTLESVIPQRVSAYPPTRMKKLIGLAAICFSLLTSQAGLTWSWAYLPADATASNAIASAMNQAVATYNTYSDYNYTIPVAYNSGVPTAQASYHGWIEFGGSKSWTVAMHEMSHWLGTGTTGNWSAYSPGTWTGGYVNNNIQAYDGPNAVENCDTQHYWPYGWNSDGGDGLYPERLVGLVGAFLRDQGLDEDRTIGFAPGTYRLRNRATIKLLDTEGSTNNGAQVKAYSASGSVNQRWILSLVPGTNCFTLQSVANGKYLDSLGNTTDGSAIGLAAASASTNQQWRVLKTDGGFYQIINVASGKALDTGGQNAEGAGMQGWASSGNRNQQWKFVHITPAATPVGLISQFRPVTASSSLGAHLPENAVDGNTTVTRWTANGGSYPQWWRVDLGSTYNLTNVITYWYPGYAFKFRIEVSSNDVNYTTAMDATGNAVVGTTTNIFSASARYVRITAIGITPSGGYASFYDCQIFGSLQTPPPPTGGLLHRYNFTSNANDSVGTAHGTLRGSATLSGGALNTTAVAGSLSGGVPQNGVQLPPSAVTNITGPFTIESWFVANYGGGYCTLFSFSGNNTGSYILATPARGNSPYASTVSVIGGGGRTSEQQASEQFQDNSALHQMIVTYDGTALSYYIDGALGSYSNLPPTITNPGLVLATLTYIGINGGSPWGDNSINGSTRDFRIYGQALTAGQVTNLYALGAEASNAAITAVLTPPAAPIGLTATPGNGQATLSWTASSGASSYNLKRATVSGGSYSTITNVTSTAGTNANLANGTTYFYVVSAVNISGESTNSAQVSVLPTSTTPVNLTMSVSDGTLGISWPSDHTGWRLFMQTNQLANGLSVNTNDWTTIPNSQTTNLINLPLDPTTPAGFYRLVYP